MLDTVIIGGGIAGLSAAWELRNKNILLLEANDRFGGRVFSERRGKYWMNYGAHVYNGENSATDHLLKSVGVEASKVPGTVTGIAMNGKVITSGKVETYPFIIPMSLRSRLGILKAGAKVRLAVMEYGKVVKRKPNETFNEHQQRIYNYKNDETFQDYIGKLPEDAEALFKPTVTRSSGEMDQISAGAGIGYFHLVWSKEDGLSRNINGGPSTLTNTIAESLGDRAQSGAEVYEVIQHADSVVVKYRQGDEEREVHAKYAVLATPAPITKKIVKNIDNDLYKALDQIKYGPYVSAAFLTNEKGEQIWDDAYAIATPKRSFNVAFNMSNLVRSMEEERGVGSTFMTFSPANLARAIYDKSDDEILDIYINDLVDIFPQFRDILVEAKVQRFYHGLPYCFPGRAKLQPILTKPAGRMFLAGDYLGTLYTETSIFTGYEAAQNILNKLNQ